MEQQDTKEKTPKKNFVESVSFGVKKIREKANNWLAKKRTEKPKEEAEKTQKSAIDRIAVLAPTIILGLGSISLNVNQARIDGKLPNFNTIAESSTENVIIAKDKALTFVDEKINGKLLPKIPKPKNFKEIKLTKDQQEKSKELGILAILTTSLTGIAGVLDDVRSKFNKKKTEKKEKVETLDLAKALGTEKEINTTRASIVEVPTNQEESLKIVSQEGQDDQGEAIVQSLTSQEIIPEIEEVKISPLQEAINNKRKEFEGDEEGLERFDTYLSRLKKLECSQGEKLDFVNSYDPSYVPLNSLEVAKSKDIISDYMMESLKDGRDFTDIIEDNNDEINDKIDLLNIDIDSSDDFKKEKLLEFLNEIFIDEKYRSSINNLHQRLVKKLDSKETIIIRSDEKFKELTCTPYSEIYTWYEENKQRLSDFYTGELDEIDINAYLIKSFPELIKSDREKIYTLLKARKLENNDGLNAMTLKESDDIAYKEITKRIKNKVRESLIYYNNPGKTEYTNTDRIVISRRINEIIRSMGLDLAISVNDRDILMEEIIGEKLDEIIVAKEQELEKGREAIKSMIREFIIRKYGYSEVYSDETKEKISDNFSQKQNNDPEIAKIINEVIEEIKIETREIKVKKLAKIREQLKGVYYPILDNYSEYDKVIIGTNIKLALGYNQTPTEFKDLLDSTIENLQEEAKKLIESKELEEKKYHELKEKVKKNIIKEIGSKETYSLEEKRKLFQTVRYNITVTTISNLEKEDLLNNAIQEVEEEAKQVRLEKEKNGRDIPITMPNI